jgi:hypothetical protein
MALVSFVRQPNGVFTDAYKNLFQAVKQAREMCEAKCISMVQDRNESNAQVVYALAGLRLSGLDAGQFNALLDTAAARSGTFTFSRDGNSQVVVSMSDVRSLFNSEYRSRGDFQDPDAPQQPVNILPRGGIQPVATGRAPAPAHRTPTCERGHRMAVQLLHVDAFCDACKMPLASYVPCWTCEPCDADLCHPCAVRRFAPQVLAGGAAGPVPINPPTPQPMPPIIVPHAANLNCDVVQLQQIGPHSHVR